jgi:hypothetical protein
MPTSQVDFPIQTYLLPNGQPVAKGYLQIHLNYDCLSPSGQIGARVRSNVDLNDSGQIPDPGSNFWPNSSLNPSTSVYILETYNSDGLRVLGPLPITVAASPFGNVGFGASFGTSFGS